jgi:hypothetical protein
LFEPILSQPICRGRCVRAGCPGRSFRAGSTAPVCSGRARACKLAR